METMANIAVQRIKREFKEVLKSEEVCCRVCHSKPDLNLFHFLRLNESDACSLKWLAVASRNALIIRRQKRQLTKMCHLVKAKVKRVPIALKQPNTFQPIKQSENILSDHPS